MTTIAERSTRLVNVGGFAGAGAPEKLRALPLSCPVDAQYILRMVVRTKESEKLIWLPKELDWITPLMTVALSHQRSIGVYHPFCYITVRHGLVHSRTDDEWHVDGFSTKTPHLPEQNYIWCNREGTEYVPTDVGFPVDFDPLKHNVNFYLQNFVEENAVSQCESGVVYCLDPYILHRRPACTFGTLRTFVRISFVPIEIDDINNTQNPLLPRTYSNDGVKYRNGLIPYAAS